MKVKNVKGSSKISSKAPTPFSSWLNYWESYAGFILKSDTLYQCPACGNKVSKDDFEGCHVRKASIIDSLDQNWYLVPLCKACNHRTDVFDIGDIKLVPVPSNL